MTQEKKVAAFSLLHRGKGRFGLSKTNFRRLGELWVRKTAVAPYLMLRTANKSARRSLRCYARALFAALTYIVSRPEAKRWQGGLMEVTGKEPLDLPALDWRMVLKQAVAHLCLTNAEPTDQVDESEDGRVIYAGYSVITDLELCWVGMTKDTLVPGWYCVTQQRVAKDDSIAAVWAQYGDAQTLMAQP